MVIKTRTQFIFFWLKVQSLVGILPNVLFTSALLGVFMAEEGWKCILKQKSVIYLALNADSTVWVSWYHLWVLDIDTDEDEGQRNKE